MHYMALKQNREIDAKNNAKMLKEAGELDRTHYNARKENRAKGIRRHY